MNHGISNLIDGALKGSIKDSLRLFLRAERMLDLMDSAFQDFEKGMPSKPILNSGGEYRFKEKSPHQAIFQKLARSQSLVRAIQLLLKGGFGQEQSILHRALGETNAEIMFLFYAVREKNITKLHRDFLKAFWKEEVDESENSADPKQKRPMVAHIKILNYIADRKRTKLKSALTEGYHKDMRSVYKFKSDFVHGASPQIMSMYEGTPPHFHIKGLLKGPSKFYYEAVFLICVGNTLLSYILGAVALKDKKQKDILTKNFKEYKF